MIGDELRRQANVFTHLAELGAAQILSSGNPAAMISVTFPF